MYLDPSEFPASVHIQNLIHAYMYDCLSHGDMIARAAFYRGEFLIALGERNCTS